MAGWTQTPNFIYDLMPEMKEAEIKVVMAIVRETIGWKRESVSLSLSDLQRLTKMARASVNSGIQAAIKRGILERTDDGQSFIYKVVEPPSKPELVQNLNHLEDETSSNSEPELVQILDSELVQNLDPIQRNIYTNKQTTKAEGIAANATPTPPVDTVAEKPKPKRRRRVTPKEPAKPKPPAIVVFEEIHHRRPKSTQEPSITTVVVDLELWRQVVQKWSNRGYNPLNIDGQLDWYKHPEKMNALNGGTNGNHHRNSQGNYQRPETTQYTMAEHLAHDAEQRAKGRPF